LPDSAFGVLRRSGASQHPEQLPEKPYTPTPMSRLVAGAIHHRCTSTVVVSNQSFTEAAINLAETDACRLIGTFVRPGGPF